MVFSILFITQRSIGTYRSKGFYLKALPLKVRILRRHLISGLIHFSRVFLKLLPYSDKYFNAYIYASRKTRRITARKQRLRSDRNLERGYQFGIALNWQANDCIQEWRFINSRIIYSFIVNLPSHQAVSQYFI
jgi:hypothetical protein